MGSERVKTGSEGESKEEAMEFAWQAIEAAYADGALSAWQGPLLEAAARLRSALARRALAGRADTDAVRVLTMLVKLKDGPRDDEYRRLKEIAWDLARGVVRGVELDAELEALLPPPRSAEPAGKEDK